MTVHIEKLGDTENRSPPVQRPQFIEDRRTFRCDVCKCGCVITTTIHVEGVRPEWCPFENDQTNLRYAKWEAKE